MPGAIGSSERITIPMSGAVEDVEGKHWPQAANGAYLGMSAIERPSEILVKLPSSRTISSWSKHTILQQERGIITVISILPLADVTSFENAVTRCEEIAHSEKIEDTKFFETIAHWRPAPKDSDRATDTYMARTRVENGINLYFKIKPANDKKGWFVVLEYQKSAENTQ